MGNEQYIAISSIVRREFSKLDVKITERILDYTCSEVLNITLIK